MITFFKELIPFSPQTLQINGEVIPSDLLFRIFEEIPRSEWGKIRTVCRAWNYAIKKHKDVLPKPLRSYFNLPTLIVTGKKSVNNHTGSLLIEKNGKTTSYISVQASQLFQPLTLIVEPWGRRAIAIKYRYQFKKISGVTAIVLHQKDNTSLGWKSSQDTNNFMFEEKGLKFTSAKLSLLFRQNWQNNQKGELDYLEKLLRGERCGLIYCDGKENHVAESSETEFIQLALHSEIEQ